MHQDVCLLPHPLPAVDCIVFYDFHTDTIHDVVFHGGEQGRAIPAQVRAPQHPALGTPATAGA